MGITCGARSSALAAAALLAAVSIADCGISQPSPNRSSLSNGDNGRTVSVAVGEGIDITLQTIGPGEYSTSPIITSGAVRLASVSNVNPQNPGGPRQLFQFDAVARGQATISIPHTVQSTVFELTVDVR